MNAVWKIAFLVVCVCLFYTYIGYSVPQKEEHPPQSIKKGATAEQLAAGGEAIFKSTCTQCHKESGERAPNLEGLALRAVGLAKKRAAATGAPYTVADYIAESLADPDAYVAEKQPGEKYQVGIMSFKLQPLQALAVIAYLETLGGEATVTEAGKVWKRWGPRLGAGAGGAAAPPPRKKKNVGPPEKIVKDYGCVGCHDMVGQKRLLGPPLSDIGSRLGMGDILLQILYPDTPPLAKAPKGQPQYVGKIMKTTLENKGFYRDVGEKDLQKLVKWLFAKKGKGAVAPDKKHKAGGNP